MQRDFNVITFNPKNRTEMKATALAYKSSTINRDFRIKAAGIDPQGNRINTLVGVSCLIALIGIEFANKFLNRAYSNGEDKCCCKLRRGIRITFYWK